MRPHIPLAAVAGKTIESVESLEESRFVMLFFTDGSFSCIRSLGGGSVSTEGEFYWFNCLDEDLIRLDIMSAEEIAQTRAQNEADLHRKREEFERETYERLKTKYGA